LGILRERALAPVPLALPVRATNSEQTMRKNDFFAMTLGFAVEKRSLMKSFRLVGSSI
jgi:hypothetical protein